MKKILNEKQKQEMEKLHDVVNEILEDYQISKQYICINLRPTLDPKGKEFRKFYQNFLNKLESKKLDFDTLEDVIDVLKRVSVGMSEKLDKISDQDILVEKLKILLATDSESKEVLSALVKKKKEEREAKEKED